MNYRARSSAAGAFTWKYNYVAPALRADGLPVVLKVAFPGRELLTEVAALRVYAGRGNAQSLDADEERGAFLLERLEPGISLASLEDDSYGGESALCRAEILADLLY